MSLSKASLNPINLFNMKSIHKNILLFLFSASLLLPLSIKAQEEETSSPNERIFKPFKVGWGNFTGYAFAGSASGISAARGFSLIYIEPKYAITDKIGIGFRGEFFLIGNGTAEVRGTAGALSTYLLTSDYTFTTTVVRPSLGLGLGLYSQKNTDITLFRENVSLLKDRATFGISPRAQLNFGPVLLGLTYHLTFDEEVYDFFSLNLGFEFGGRRYKKRPKSK